MKKILVRYYLTSGKEVNVEYIEENFEKIKKNLQNDWNNSCLMGEKIGINFSLVTHYTIEEIQQ